MYKISAKYLCSLMLVRFKTVCNKKYEADLAVLSLFRLLSTASNKCGCLHSHSQAIDFTALCFNWFRGPAPLKAIKSFILGVAKHENEVGIP